MSATGAPSCFCWPGQLLKVSGWRMCRPTARMMMGRRSWRSPERMVNSQRVIVASISYQRIVSGNLFCSIQALNVFLETN